MAARIIAALGACACLSAAAAPGVLEEHLDRYYHAASAALGEGASCLRDDQRLWQRNVRDACEDARCLEAAYLDRLAELDALQPGATAIRNRELPRRPALAWIVPPAADKVAAPPNPKAAPATVTGTLVDEIAAGDGVVLRTMSGERYVLVLLMFLDGKTAERLPLLARERGAVFTARGHLAPAGGGTRAFEPSRCLFLYRHETVTAPK